MPLSFVELSGVDVQLIINKKTRRNSSGKDNTAAVLHRPLRTTQHCHPPKPHCRGVWFTTPLYIGRLSMTTTTTSCAHPR